MRTNSRIVGASTQFKRDWKREKKGRQAKVLDSAFGVVLDALATDQELPPKYQDHALCGEWIDCRDCHIRPDLILIYRRIGEDKLHLLRLGSHSELGL
ncbi:MAG: type II toxin-antitoxin system YafQ family toxin [Propionibacteriaceae bacterium]|jgi:mRNA interferase YafQ|nr:type II toxin-antitoxin system YafQ family toxin [Propionibacteriaceae bacterium]